MRTEHIIAIAGLIPGVATPAVAWIYAHNAKAKHAKEIHNLHTRLELVEKLYSKLKVNPDLESKYKPILDLELKDILHDFELNQELQVPVPKVSESKDIIVQADEVDKKSSSVKSEQWKRFWLKGKQLSIGGIIFKGLFRFSFFIAIVGGISGIYNMWSGSENATFTNTDGDLVQIWPYMLFGVGFYMYIGWLSRKAALRNNEKIMKRLKAK